MPVKKTCSFWWCKIIIFFLKVDLSPLQSLVVANGGLGNGVSRQELSAALTEMGELETLIMNPHKPYAFVTYRCCLDSATIPPGRFLLLPFWHILLMCVTLFPGLKSVLGKLTSSSTEKSYCVERTPSRFTSVLSTQVHKIQHPQTQSHLLEHVQYALFMCVQSHVKRRRPSRCQKD